ncbi:MAG TPA: IS21-like element helper ATPase IstB [Zeimonas sp.]|nr:IS21-like element helper ATPase IstB [Zeimonas sp.]
MLTEPLIEQLNTLRLRGMAASLEQQLAAPDVNRQPFENRLALMIQQEMIERGNARLAQRLRWAKLPVQACVEDLDTRTPRGIDPGQLAQLTDLGWIREHLNLLITGPTGVGKSFIASALAHAACRADFSVRCFRLPRLVEELARYAAIQKRSALYRQLAKVDLIMIDDFGLTPLADENVRDLLEILDDRYDRRSTLITSQLPIDQWHAYLGDRTVADAILDRLVHNSYRLTLKGESMRRRRSASATPSRSTKAR